MAHTIFPNIPWHMIWNGKDDDMENHVCVPISISSSFPFHICFCKIAGRIPYMVNVSGIAHTISTSISVSGKLLGLCCEISHVHQTQDSSVRTCRSVTMAMPQVGWENVAKPVIFREKKTDESPKGMCSDSMILRI